MVAFMSMFPYHVWQFSLLVSCCKRHLATSTFLQLNKSTITAVCSYSLMMGLLSGLLRMCSRWKCITKFVMPTRNHEDILDIVLCVYNDIGQNLSKWISQDSAEVIHILPHLYGSNRFCEVTTAEAFVCQKLPIWFVYLLYWHYLGLIHYSSNLHKYKEISALF